MQGFIFMSFILISLFNTRFHSHLISFHFFFLKNKKNKTLCNFTCDLLLCLQISDLKCGQACGKNMTKNSQVNGSLRENISVFLIAPSCFNKQKKCRYERTFKERNRLAFKNTSFSDLGQKVVASLNS